MILDIIAACLIALGFYLGYQRGLIKTVFDTLSLFIGILAALKLSPIVINILEGIINVSPAITFILGIVITFIGVMALIRYAGRKLEDLLEAVNINFVNKIAGGGVQAIFFAVLLSYVFYLGSSIGVINQKVKEDSMSYRHLETLPSYTQSGIEKMKPVFKGFWNKTLETMDAIKGKTDDENTNEENRIEEI
jgi:membrane protein required for colicin V production